MTDPARDLADQIAALPKPDQDVMLELIEAVLELDSLPANFDCWMAGYHRAKAGKPRIELFKFATPEWEANCAGWDYYQSRGK